MFRLPTGFSDFIQINDSIWFASGNYNALYKYNLKEKKLEWINIFRHESLYQGGLFLKMCQYKSNLIFIPQYSKRIYIYNVDRNHLIDIEIPKLSERLQPPYFCEAVIYEEYLFMMGAMYPGILKVNLENYAIDIIDQWILELGKKVKLDSGDNFLGMEGVMEKNRFFIPCYQSNMVLELHLDTCKFHFHEVGNKDCKYARIIKTENNFVLTTHDRNNLCCVVAWDILKNDIKQVQCDMQAYVDRLSVEYFGSIWIFSLVSNEIINLSVSSGEVRYYSIPNVEKTEIMFAKVINNELFFGDSCTNAWYKINAVGSIEKVGFDILDDKAFYRLKQMMIDEGLKDYYIRECMSYPVKIWMKQVVAQKKIKEKGKQDKSVGQSIYAHV